MEEDIYKIKVDNNFKQAAGDANALGASIEHVTDAGNENASAVKNQDAAYKTFKTQLREANAELQKQIQLTGESSQETIKAAKAVAELKDQMGFAKDLADNFNPDQKMKALGAATQVAGTAMQGMTAGMALFGSESADTQKQLLKVQAAMAFSDAISQMSNLGDQWKLLKATIQSSTVVTKANTAATGAAAMIQNLFTGSVTTTSAGFKALKFAIAATGIGLLIVGLGLVVANFEKIKKVVFNLVPGLATVGDTIMSIVNAVTDFIGVTSEADRAVDRMKANADASLALNKKFLAEHGSQLDEFTKQKIAAKDKYNEAIKEDGADQIALAKELNRELAKIEYSRGDEARKIQKENADKAKEDAEKRRKEEADRLAKIAEEKKKFDEETAAGIREMNVKKHQQDLQDAIDRQAEINVGIEAAFAAGDATQEDLDKQKERDIDSDNKKLEAKKQINTALMSLGESALAGAKDLFGKNKKVQKGIVATEGAVALGKLATNTVEAVAKDNAVSPTTLGMPWSGIHIGMGVLGATSIISNTNKQLQALGGGSIAGGSTPNFSGGGSAPQATPQVAFNNTAENQIGQSINRTAADNPPFKVYVAESDISDAQNSVKVLVNKNTI